MNGEIRAKLMWIETGIIQKRPPKVAERFKWRAMVKTETGWNIYLHFVSN